MKKSADPKASLVPREGEDEDGNPLRKTAEWEAHLSYGLNKKAKRVSGTIPQNIY